MDKINVRGGCHCGAVVFEAMLPRRVEARQCNCSICRMTGYVHLTVHRDDFRLLEGADCLQEYRFNTGTARHLFCGNCGVKSYYVPRSHPEGYSVNFNCVELPPEIEVDHGAFDGQNWEQHVGSIRHLGQGD